MSRVHVDCANPLESFRKIRIDLLTPPDWAIRWVRVIQPTGFIIRSRAQLEFPSLNERKGISLQGVLPRLARSGTVAR